jgi:lambda family phage tail tape measure protein
MAIQRRDDLTPSGRQTLIEWERQQLPEVIRDTENQLVTQAKESAARQAAIAEAESPADAGRKLRALGLEGEQAEDVVTYLSERESFKQQYDDYQQALQETETAGLAPQEREAQREALLARHFKSEQKRTWARLRQLDGSG